MKRPILLYFIFLGLCIGMLLGGTTVRAGETGHYINGVEGIKAATLPPPGFYWRLYNTYYTANTLNDKEGNKLDLGFDVDVFAFVNRFLWVTNKKILGANYAADIVIPLVNTNIKFSKLNTDRSKFGLGDIAIEPFVLSWHGNLYDISFGLAIYAPIGDYDENNPATPGKDFWTEMTTIGGTYYFDLEKTWSASILARYEVHTEKRDSDIRPGNDFHFEWGLGKTLAKVWDVGITGYCQWQITDDSGVEAVNKDVHDKVFAIGPEISTFIPNENLFLSLRSLWEFGAEDRSEGTVTTLTLTKFF